jgi:hypothetical protein
LEGLSALKSPPSARQSLWETNLSWKGRAFSRSELKLQHGFRSAQVSIWVDGDLAYSSKVTGSPKKKFGLIPTDSVQGTFSHDRLLTPKFELTGNPNCLIPTVLKDFDMALRAHGDLLGICLA